MKPTEVATFYDRYVAHQARVAFNERHLHLMKVMRQLGLAAESRVLELGCGIGVMTTLMSQIVIHGRIEAVDISPASIEAARQRMAARPDVTFQVGDATTFRSQQEDWDFVVLFDVLEHIPLDLHRGVFETIAHHAGEATLVVINIPNPRFTEYLREHHADQVQIIDESVEAAPLIAHAEASGLALLRFETYGVWREDEYQLILLRRKGPFEAVPIRQPILQRNVQWVRRFIARVVRRLLPKRSRIRADVPN